MMTIWKLIVMKPLLEDSAEANYRLEYHPSDFSSEQRS